MDFEGQRTGEEVVLVFRRHILTTIRGFLVMLLLIGGGALPMILMPDDPQLFWLWVACIVLGVLGYLYSYMLWHFSYYLVTNERIRQVRQKGMFKRTVVDLELDNIQSISFGVMGVFGSLFDYGTILIQTGVGDLSLSMVSHPENVYNEIQNAKHGEGGEEE
ncbi:PH domain-containing protein [Candidatus Saccharibacteria bacterium]|nr:PH domain-containing protein [Candidatus Saccharibacteria bacterium]